MSAMIRTKQFTAGGVIRPSRFVKQSTSVPYTVLEADANEVIIGISQTGTHDAPGLSGATGYAANADKDNMGVFLPGEICPLELGSGGATIGGRLKSDADGKGVLIASSGTTAQNVGAIALESGSAGEIIDVLVFRQDTLYPALA